MLAISAAKSLAMRQKWRCMVGWLVGCLLVAWLVGWCMVYGGVNQQSPANGYG